MALGTPELVYAFDPGGVDEDYPEQPQAYSHPTYGATILVPGYLGSIYILDGGAIVDTWGSSLSLPGAIHADGTFLEGVQKRNAGGSVASANYLASTDTDSPWTLTVPPVDLTVDSSGVIWGATDQRSILAWNSDGTIHRDYNNTTAPGPTVPDGPRAITWHDGLLYLASYDGVWVTDPYDSANVVDDWAPRSGGDLTRPDGYTLHFTRLVDIDTDDGFDTGHLSWTYQGGIAVQGGRVYFTDTGRRSSSLDVAARILSAATTGTDQTPVVEYAPSAFADGGSSFGITGLQNIDGYLYAAAWDSSQLFRWPLAPALTFGPTTGYIGPGAFFG